MVMVVVDVVVVVAVFVMFVCGSFSAGDAAFGEGGG